MKPRHLSPALLRSSLTLCLTCTLQMPVAGGTLVWTGDLAWDWATAANWNPAAVPTADDTVVIGTGTVNLPSNTTTTVASLELGAADANLSGLGSRLVVTDEAVIGTTREASLRLDGGAFLQGAVLLGAGGTGQLRLSGTNGGTPTTFSGTLQMGLSAGDSGRLNVDGGARASVRNPVTLGLMAGTSAEVHIWGIGENSVRSTWQDDAGTNELTVGGSGNGVFIVGAGAYAVSSSPVIADGIGSEGRVSVGGRWTDGIQAEWVTTGTLTIGRLGTGSMGIAGGGKVTSQDVVIGGYSSGSGTAILYDGGLDGPARWNIGGTLWIAQSDEILPAGSGDLQIYAGAEVRSGRGVIGENGTVTVSGSHYSGGGSAWLNDSDIFLDGKLYIDEGARVTSRDSVVIGTRGELTVMEASHGKVPSSLESELLEITPGGRASILGGGMVSVRQLESLDASTTVSGTYSGTSSTLLVETSADFTGSRSLAVSEGGLVKADVLTLLSGGGRDSVDDFTATVTGVGELGERSRIEAGWIFLSGTDSPYTAGLAISGGAKVTTGRLSVQDGSRLDLAGGHFGLRSTLEVTDYVDVSSGTLSIREGAFAEVKAMHIDAYGDGPLLEITGRGTDPDHRSTLITQGPLTLGGSDGDRLEIAVGPGGLLDTGTLRIKDEADRTIRVSGALFDVGQLRLGGFQVDRRSSGSTTIILDGGEISFSASGEMFRGLKDGDIRLEGAPSYIRTELTTNEINVGMQGTGELRKVGGGTLDLRGASTYSGMTQIYEGTLLANNTTGSATGSGDVIVHVGGTLGGNGFISGNVFNGGRVAPGNSPGTLHIGGDFNQFGNLVMEIGQDGKPDLLLVGGRAKLDGVLEIVTEGPVAFGTRQTLIDAEKGIEGTFQNVTFSNGVDARGRLIVNGGILSIQVAPKAYSQLATNPNERALAGVLDTWITSDNGDTRTVAENLDLLSADEYRGVFNVLSPSLFAAGLATSIEQSQGQMMALNQHLNSRRLRPAVPNDAENPWEAWAISTGAYSPGSMSSLAGEDYSAGNFIAGIERRVVPGVTAGLFNSYGDSEGDFAGSSEIEEERFTLGAHATAQYGGSYANTALGFGILEMDVKRSIAFGNLSRKARSSTDGTEFFAMLSGGHDFRQGNWIFGPSAGLQYSKVRYDDVKENGAGALDLVVSNPEDDSLRSQIGGRVAYLHKANERLTLIPEARVFWQHDFLRDNETLDAAMEQGLGLGFQHQVADSDGDSVFTGIGLGFQTDFGFYGNVSYDLEFGREGDVNQTLSVGADWKF